MCKSKWRDGQNGECQTNRNREDRKEARKQENNFSTKFRMCCRITGEERMLLVEIPGKYEIQEEILMAGSWSK